MIVPYIAVLKVQMTLSLTLFRAKSK